MARRWHVVASAVLLPLAEVHKQRLIKCILSNTGNIAGARCSYLNSILNEESKDENQMK